MVRELIRRARRRYILQESLAQLALAASLAIGGLALLLLFGTAYLDWWSVLLLGLAGLGYGIWRVRQRTPTEYGMAVQLDQNAALQDSLSTALYFEEHSSSAAEFHAFQRQQAEDIARGVDLERAVPFSTPRALYAMAALCLLATALFAVRYHATQSLDLRAPLTQVLFEDQENPALAKAKQKAQPKTGKKSSAADSLLAKLGVSLNGEKQQTPDALDQAIEEALKAPGVAAEADKKGQAPGAAAKDGKAAAPGEQGTKGDPMDGAQPDNAGKDADSNSPPGDKDAKSGEQGGKNGNSGDNGSLMSKLKDAVSNILSKAKQDARNQKDGQQQSGQQQGTQQQAKSEKGGDKGKSGQGQQQGQEQASSQEGDPNGDSQDGQKSQGKSGAKDSNQQASSQPGSGIGHQDGAKDLKASEQLKAMGKLSEIIGRRAQTVSGETSIEVQSGSQQLRTSYTNTSAAHAETDGDVNRDEVPVALQSYVQQYFQQVRKAGEVSARDARTIANKTGAKKPVTP